MGLLEGLSVPECVEKVKKAGPQTFFAGGCYWPIVNTFGFLYVPPAGRVAYVNAAGVLWNTWLSYENDTQGHVDHEQVQEEPQQEAVEEKGTTAIEQNQMQLVKQG